ncbi:MAG: hypothetical protein LC745_01265 [Planctomycetia bacterium]|nr:hypothetical protein [Planctomycetia bacterium]
MSTAGKVLAVLVMLMAVVWVFLTAAATQLNRNGASAVEGLKKDVEKLEADVTAAEHDIRKTKDEWDQDQVTTQKRLTVLAARQSDVEKDRSRSQETLTRVTFQLAQEEANVKASEGRLAQNIADKKSETEALASARADVERLKAERAEMVARLNELRGRFKSVLSENRSLVQRLQKKAGVPASRPATAPGRPASYTR